MLCITVSPVGHGPDTSNARMGIFLSLVAMGVQCWRQPPAAEHTSTLADCLTQSSCMVAILEGAGMLHVVMACPLTCLADKAVVPVASMGCSCNRSNKERMARRKTCMS